MNLCQSIEKMKKIFCRQEVLVKDPTAGIPFVAKTEITGIANKKNEIQILFAETENPYPFQFWSSATSNLYRYQLKVNGENHR